MAEGDRFLYVKVDGTVEQDGFASEAQTLSGDSDPASLVVDADRKAIVIEFDSSADGRGFSLARHLRNRLGFEGALYAAGELIPDQVLAAFSCGFDAVLVSKEQQTRYGLQHWLDTVETGNKAHYWADGGAGTRQVWSERAELQQIR